MSQVLKPAIRKARKGPNWFKNESAKEAENIAGLDEVAESEETEEEKIVQPLIVEGIDLKPLSNKFLHHTYEYEHSELIVRRGDDFRIKVTFKDGYNRDKDTVIIKLSVGDRPLRTKGTLLDLKVADQTLDCKEWGAVCESVYRNEATFKIMPAADAIVGRYKIAIDTRRPSVHDGKIKRRLYKHDEDFIVLFNPWCKDDDVFLENDDERKEYVLNQTGEIYNMDGHGRAWNFGQFEKECLDCALYILGESGLAYQAMGNPVRVVRSLSAMVNSSDFFGGVLEGNWTGNFAGGTAPTSWNGSVTILGEYLETKKPVQFGQCWVFSGVSTTVCRALGIPCRSITNYCSAHDQDETMTIDIFIDCEGNFLSKTSDSIWNFHVWNEAWFKRPDLPEGNDGWQVFDATPQERSDGQYQCGPCPVSAVKRGDVFLNYDAKFIFAEVNGDKVTWMMNAKIDPDSDGEALIWNENGEPDMKPVRVDQFEVGENISTKAVGKLTRELITDSYKEKEGTKIERMIAARVSVHSSRSRELAAMYELEKQYDVEFDFKGEMDKRGNLTVTLKMKNTAKENRKIIIQSHAQVQYYAGNPGENLGHHKWEKELTPEEEDSVTKEITAVEYLNTLKDDGTVAIHIFAKVEGTAQIFTQSIHRKVEDPELGLIIDNETVQQGEEFEVIIVMTNPLDIPLTGCELSLEGPGTLKAMNVPIKKTIGPGKSLAVRQKLKARFEGKRELIGALNSKQLRGVTGSVTVDVVKDKPTEPPAEAGVNTAGGAVNVVESAA